MFFWLIFILSFARTNAGKVDEILNRNPADRTLDDWKNIPLDSLRLLASAANLDIRGTRHNVAVALHRHYNTAEILTNDPDETTNEEQPAQRRSVRKKTIETSPPATTKSKRVKHSEFCYISLTQQCFSLIILLYVIHVP